MKNIQENEYAFHTTKKEKSYFEGWYYKIQTKELSLAIIIGIHQINEKREAFIQTVDTIQKLSTYETFQEEDMYMSEQPFKLQLGKNIISREYLIVHSEKANLNIDVKFRHFTPLKCNLFMPTIMGPFSYIPMECIHSIISLHHQVEGNITIQNKRYDAEGIGYIEKDRGTSFPKQYLWFQSNQSNSKKSCFFLSIAHIPILISHFQGCICILMIAGREYRFASYLGCVIEQFKPIKKDNHNHVYSRLRQGFYTVDIHILQQASYPLKAPKEGAMGVKIEESLNSKAKVVLYHHDIVVQELIFERAGFEINKY